MDWRKHGSFGRKGEAAEVAEYLDVK